MVLIFADFANKNNKKNGITSAIFVLAARAKPSQIAVW